jgi:hypothetical protein
MSDEKSTKRIVRVEGGTSQANEPNTFVPSGDSKAKAKSLRIYAIILWLLGIGCEIGAIFVLKQIPINTLWLIVLIVADLALVIIGSLLWKKANRFDPASERDKVRFFIQNQLGTIISIIAFLPLIILIFTNKNMDGKQKGIVGAVAVVALLIAGITSYDFNPPSTEQYASQIEEVTSLTGNNFVYWTKSGTHYHLYKDCGYINTAKTTEIFEGTVEQAKDIKNIVDLCSRCKSQIEKEKGLNLPHGDIKEAPKTTE